MVLFLAALNLPAEVRRRGIVALESATPGLKMTQLRGANMVFTEALQSVDSKVSQIPDIDNAKKEFCAFPGLIMMMFSTGQRSMAQSSSTLLQYGDL